MSSGMGGRRLKKYFVTIDGKEYEEEFIPDHECVFCEAKGSYVLNNIGFCDKCLKENYKGRVRVEEVSNA